MTVVCDIFILFYRIAPAKPSKSKSKPKKRKRPPSIKEVKHLPVTIMQQEPSFVSAQPIVDQAPIVDETQNKMLNNINQVVNQSATSNANSLNLGLGLGPLTFANGLKVELDHEVFLDTAENVDFGNVLSNLPADAFNDLFIGNDCYDSYFFLIVASSDDWSKEYFYQCLIICALQRVETEISSRLERKLKSWSALWKRWTRM